MFKTKLTPIADYIFGAKVLNIMLPLLMVYLVVGTVAQKSMGLYHATEVFFFSPVVWLGNVVPLPGVPILLGALLFCLCGHLVFKSPFRKRKVGILITHLGVVFLVGAGLFSSFVVQEGALVLEPHSPKATYADYHKRVVRVVDAEGDIVTEMPFKNFLTETPTSENCADLPFPYALLEACENCNIIKRTQDGQSFYIGMAQHMQLTPKALEAQNEQNLSGLTIAVPSPAGENSIYLALEGVPVLPEITYNESTYTLQVLKEPRSLPFKVELLDFQRDTHPGTNMASAYQSHVRIIDGTTQWEGLIKMNDPMRYKGYALFQSSFTETPDQVQSVLAVVYNPYRVWPYYATGLIALGLIVHLLFGRSRRGKAALIFAAILLGAPQAMATESQPLALDEFKTLPILHEGRIKPIESFTEVTLKPLGVEDPNQALAELVLAPATAAIKPYILVKSKAVINALELTTKEPSRYSFAELQKAFAQKRALVEPLISAKPEARTPAQQSLVELYEHTQTLAQLLSSLTVLMPLDVRLDDLPPQPDAYYSYAQWQPHRAVIQQRIEQVVKQKGGAVQDYSMNEQALAFLSFTLTRLEAEGKHATLFKVVPTVQEDAPLASPWDVVNQALGTPQTAEHFGAWQTLARAYNDHNPQLWQQTLQQLHTLTPASRMVQAEVFYNSLAPVKTSFALYGLGLLVLLAGAVLAKPTLANRALLPLVAGGLVHLVGVALRVAILQRPPVGTLYESVIFVGLVLVVFTLWRSLKTRDSIWLWLGATGGMLLQALALTLPQTGDDMTMLTAVLNTNFWLLIHVLTITAGYGFCLVVSGLAHVCYARDDWQKRYRPALRNAVRLALLFTFVGTLLGGVWADQSWGRFWGWDPKENGALLIVLWLVWLLHGEVAKALPWRFVLAGYVLLSGVVALSWLGVNLLSVGLHNYGFTEAMAIVLGGVWAAEIAFLAIVQLKRERL
tara:strand:- start:2440 stop:5322 length:2883 start_codon:yes stop_codon:yes gene_type:complete